MTLEKGMNPATMTLADAINLIENIKTKNVIASFKENDQVKVVNGRYGAYITNGSDNFKIPKGTVAENMTYNDCMEIIKNTAPTAKKRFPRKK
jgi:DNA topoisomerase-1